MVLLLNRKTADRAKCSIGGRRLLFIYVRLSNLIRFISFIYIPHAMAVFLIPYLSTAIPIRINRILFY